MFILLKQKMSFVLFLTVAIGAIVLLSACSQDEEQQSESNDTLTVWTMSQDLEKFVTAYEEETGVTVDVQSFPWDNAHEKLLTAVASGEGPDVLQIGSTWVAEFGEAGTFLDLSDHIGDYENLDLNNFYEEAVASAQYKDQTVGIPWYVDTRVLYYRTDILAEVGYPDGPETWDDVLDASRQLADRGEGQYGIEFPRTDENFPFMLAWSQGWEYNEAEGAANFGKSEFKESVELYNTFFEEELSQSNDGKELYQAFSDGSKPMYFSGPWEIDQLRDQIPELDGKWDLKVMPKTETNDSMIGGAHWSIFHNSDNVDQALDFINWMSDPETQVDWYETRNELPSNLQAWEDPILAKDDKVNTFGKQLENTRALPVIPEFNQLSEELINYLERIYRGGEDVDTVLEEYQEEAARILNK
ncbi:extracellular solute-binding protein [Paraliobacillus ryukyuensis]|uniref:extracellular solute-binding protein n=1 Tax=Paraliobacillus ryukyuensis TaxID=200904 RepID=UPI003CCC81BE